MFLAMTLVGMVLGWNLHHVRKREQLLQRYGALSYRNPSVAQSPKKVPFLWSLLGAKPVGVIQLAPDEFTGDDLSVYQAEFPEADIRRIPLLDQSPPRPAFLRALPLRKY